MEIVQESIRLVGLYVRISLLCLGEVSQEIHQLLLLLKSGKVNAIKCNFHGRLLKTFGGPVRISPERRKVEEV